MRQLSKRNGFAGLARRLRPRRRDERGAYAILFSMMLVLVMALAAISVDIASQVASKQRLKDTMDAAAHAAAYEISNPVAAKAAAIAMARRNDPTANPVVDFFCVVAATAAGGVNEAQIPGTCNPGPKPYVGVVCDEYLCFIPCVPGVGKKCNTVRVRDEDTVPYAFAPAIGYDEGSTGAVVSVACKGSCGTEQPNPLDIVVVADRTASMVTSDRAQMKSAILESLKLMDPQMHQVAFGTIAKSRVSGHTVKSKTYGPQSDDYMVENPSCLSGCKESDYDSVKKLNYNGHWDGSGKTNSNLSYCPSEAQSYATASTTSPIYKWGSGGRPRPSMSSERVRSGTWVPIGFSNDYLVSNPDPDAVPVLNNQSALVDSVSCLSQSMVGEFGTQLASALKGTVKYAFANNPAPTRVGKIRKVIIFETDGQPSEPMSFGNTDLDSGDVVSTSGNTGCSNLKSVADKAKARHGDDLIIVTIGFGDAATTRCNGGSGSFVRDVLADAASKTASGEASKANSCKGSDIAKENEDGDYFFCATDGSDLENIFATALTAVGGSIKLLKLPS